MKIYSVYDSKAEAYMPICVLRSRGEMLRVFQDLANEEGHNFCKYPGDYTLFELGEWDEQTGQFKLEKAHINLGLARDFKKDIVLPSGPKSLEG